MNWGLNELKNQVAHFFVSIFFTLIALFIIKKFEFNIHLLLLVGVIVGTSVEVYQYFRKDNRQLKLPDRIRDVFFYELASILVWYIAK